MKLGIKIAILVLFSLSFLNYSNYYGISTPGIKITNRQINNELTEINVKIVSAENLDSAEIKYYNANDSLVERYLIKKNSKKINILNYFSSKNLPNQVEITIFKKEKKYIYKENLKI